VSRRVGLIAETIDRRDGIARVAREMLAVLGRRHDVEIVAAVPPAGVEVVEGMGLPNLVATVTIPTAGQIGTAMWVRRHAARALAAHHVEVIHAGKHVLPTTGVPTVLTVHDLTLLHDPGQFRLAKRIALPHEYRRALRRADVLVTHTHAIVAAIRAADPAWGAKARRIGLPFTSELFSGPAQPVEALGGVRFALAVGDLSPRKNLAVLIDQWADIHDATGLRLVVAGSGSWRSDEAVARLEALERAGMAHWIRGLADPGLRWLYEHAAVLCYPSREEGFGLPVVEALVVGTPVISSTDPALVEVGDGRTTAIDPDDRAAWRAAIIRAAPVEPARHAPVVPAWLPTRDEVGVNLVAAYDRAISSRPRPR
jgi:glycosyltransferase involved in cell wall biosynthesis